MIGSVFPLGYSGRRVPMHSSKWSTATRAVFLKSIALTQRLRLGQILTVLRRANRKAKAGHTKQATPRASLPQGLFSQNTSPPNIPSMFMTSAFIVSPGLLLRRSQSGLQLPVTARLSLLSPKAPRKPHFKLSMMLILPHPSRLRSQTKLYRILPSPLSIVLLRRVLLHSQTMSRVY